MGAHGASESTVRRWIASGTVDAIRVNGAVFVTADSLDRLFQGRALSRSRHPWLVVLNGRYVTEEYAAEVCEDIRKSTEAQGFPYGLTNLALIDRVLALLPPQSATRVTSGGPRRPPPMHPTDLPENRGAHQPYDA